jgi:transporter family-2 protein
MYIVLAALAGSVFPIQACLNYELGKHVGTPYRAVTVNFFLGTIIMWVLVFFEYVAFRAQELPLIAQQDDGPDNVWWMWLGGLFGALIVASVTIGIPALGAVSFTVLFISTQLVSATVADAIGAFGYAVIPLVSDGGRRLIGVTIAVIATAGFRYKPPAQLKFLNEWPCSSWNLENLDELFDETEAMPPSESEYIHRPTYIDVEAGNTQGVASKEEALTRTPSL